MNRDAFKNLAVEDNFDLIVIGGGITGAGILLDATSRGLKCLLLEKNDFASGTSSKSTKLIHGGLRYLKQFEFSLVSESGRERTIVHQLAPNLCIPQKMLLPIQEGGSFGFLALSAALSVYDVLARVNKNDKKRILTKSKTIETEPLLAQEKLRGAGYYTEYRTDDARLTIEIIKTAVRLGAKAISYSEVTGFLKEDGKVKGVIAKDILEASESQFHSHHVISAAGPWVDELRKIDQSIDGKRLFLSKGVHIVIPRTKLPLNQPVYFDAVDDRMIFAIPRAGCIYIGTTDTSYNGSNDDLRISSEDRDYLLSSVNKMFPNSKIKVSDIISSWAGLRPLIHEKGKEPSELSRKDEIFKSPSGLISIAGGKLTGYRKMSDRVVSIISEKECKTDKIKLAENPYKDYNEVLDHIVSLGEILGDNLLAEYLVLNYGNAVSDILDRSRSFNYKDNGLNLILGELSYCLDNEMVIRSLDFAERRTGRLYFNPESLRKYGDHIISTMRDYFNWDKERENLEKNLLESALSKILSFV